MKILTLFKSSLLKFSKGMFAISIFYLTAFACLFIFDSCKKNEYSNSDSYKAKTKFLAALDVSKKTIGEISFGTHTSNISFGNNGGSGKIASIRPFTTMVAQTPTPGSEPVYLDFPPGTNPEALNSVYTTNSIQQLTNLVNETNAIIEYEATSENSTYVMNVPVEAIVNSLAPLIVEAKQYLYTKGLSENDIQDMIVQENGKVEDLIPFVASLTQIESNQQVAGNYSNPFISSAQAKFNPYVKCALAAIGADVLYALAGSSAVTWSKAVLVKAFGKVAQRFLGPIGVGIAVVSFAYCLNEELN